MTNEAINNYIHFYILGNRREHNWDGERRDADNELRQCCAQCGIIFTAGNGASNCNRPVMPDYCSDASPRSLLNEVVAKLLADDANGAIERSLDRKMVFARTRNAETDPRWSCPYLATAEQIARACVEAHKSEGDSNER